MNWRYVRFNILADIKEKSGFMREHGHCVLIEAFGKHIFIDAGQGKSLLSNANCRKYTLLICAMVRKRTGY